MGKRVEGFGDAHPDTDESQIRLQEEVKQLVVQMAEVAAIQRGGQIEFASGAAEKHRIRREVLAGPVAHLAEVGKRGSRVNHELGRIFRYKPGAQTYVAFLTATRTMQAAAQTHKQVLVKFGMSESVLEQMGQLLDRFESAVQLCNQGRTAHKGATQRLNQLASELAAVVRTMDARNRLRFQNDAQLLGSWISASTVLGSKRGVSGSPPAEAPAPVGEQEVGGTPSAGGEVRPAA